MPNPLRAKADGYELYTVFAHIWTDDVSGNVSKQYNKHFNFYMANTSLPGRLLQQEYFIRFLSTSQYSSTAEQFAAVKKEIEYVI